MEYKPPKNYKKCIWLLSLDAAILKARSNELDSTLKIKIKKNIVKETKEKDYTRKIELAETNVVMEGK